MQRHPCNIPSFAFVLGRSISCARSIKRRGFTLIEMLVTVVIVAILASAVFPLTHLAHKRAKEAQLRQALHEIRMAIDAYKRAADSGHIVIKSGDSGFPPTLLALVSGVDDAKPTTVDGMQKAGKIYFLRRIPRDPLEDDLGVQPQDTWGLRCYASSHEEPKAGVDVFDVYSRSKALGLNDQPYKEW
jgi:general secretion pathway protein G